jgi:hypothetical protein
MVISFPEVIRADCPLARKMRMAEIFSRDEVAAG